MEAGPPDHDHRAVGRGRRHRPGHPRSPPRSSSRRSARRSSSSTSPARRARSAPRARWRRRRTATPGPRAPRSSSERTRCSGCSNSKVDDFHLYLVGDQRLDREREPERRRTRRSPQLLDAMKAKPGQVTVQRPATAPAGTSRWKRSPRRRASSTATSHTTAATGGRRDGRRRDRDDDTARGRADRDDQGQALAPARGRRAIRPIEIEGFGTIAADHASGCAGFRR